VGCRPRPSGQRHCLVGGSVSHCVLKHTIPSFASVCVIYGVEVASTIAPCCVSESALFTPNYNNCHAYQCDSSLLRMVSNKVARYDSAQSNAFVLCVQPRRENKAYKCICSCVYALPQVRGDHHNHKIRCSMRGDITPAELIIVATGRVRDIQTRKAFGSYELRFHLPQLNAIVGCTNKRIITAIRIIL
jgi:hypothetical protein